MYNEKRVISVPFYAYEFQVSFLVHGGYTVAQLVEALPYKPEGRGFDSLWCH